MAKKIRFPLTMEQGFEVRSVEELKEHFSLEKVMMYIANGKMDTWLRDRYEDALADRIAEMVPTDEQYEENVCAVFGVTYDVNERINMERLAERERRIAVLKEYTADESILAHVDETAFSQDDLYDLLDEKKTQIYLCGDRFEIPLAKQGLRYIGVNQPVAVIRSEKVVDWESIGVTVENVRFDEKYQNVVDEKKISSAKEGKNDLFFVYSEKMTSGIYRLDEEGYHLVHARIYEDYSSDLEYGRGMAQDNNCVYMIRQKKKYGYEYEIVSYDSTEDRIASIYDIGSRRLLIITLKNNYLYLREEYAHDSKETQIMILNLETMEEKNLCIPYQISDDNNIKVSECGNYIYTIRGAYALERRNIDNGKAEELYCVEGMNHLTVSRNLIFGTGGKYVGEVFIWKYDLNIQKGIKITSASINSISMMTYYEDYLYYLERKGGFIAVYSTSNSSNLLQRIDIRDNKTATPENLTNKIANESTFNPKVGTRMWILGEYIYLGANRTCHTVLTEAYPAKWRYHLPTKRTEKLSELRYIAV